MDEKLYIIIPIFNLFGTESRTNNFQQCIQYLKNFENIEIHVVEGYLENPIFEYVSKNDNIFYTKYKMPSRLWVKENLINLAVKTLPTNWNYMAWIDADIVFLNFNWVSETIRKLKENDTVQLFRSVSFVDNNGNIYAEKHKNKKHLIIFGTVFSQKKIQKNAHPGFAWAINKKFYNHIGGLFEYNILGSGDLLYSKACSQEVFSVSSPSKGYEELKNDYFHKFSNVSCDYIDGHIIHLWHGNWETRNYNKRWGILIKNQFDPNRDLIKDNGILKLNNPSLEFDLYEHLQKREVQ